MDINEEILLYKDRNKLNYSDLGAIINKEGPAFRMAMKRNSFSELEKKELLKVLSKEKMLENEQFQKNSPSSGKVFGSFPKSNQSDIFPVTINSAEEFAEFYMINYGIVMKEPRLFSFNTIKTKEALEQILDRLPQKD